MSYRSALAPQIVPTLLANVTTRYPYHDSHVFQNEGAHNPFAVHPAFGNSFDWHSSVHSHWSALQVLAYFNRHGDAPPEAGTLRDAVTENLSAANIALETAYLKHRGSYERPYGWAWAMQLAAVTANCDEMAAVLAQHVLGWLDVLSEPVRHGVHSNTAFALWLVHEAAGKLEFVELQKIIEARALSWFGADRDWPQQWERSGNDFLSPGLCEAALMHAVLPYDEFEPWLLAFLPSLDSDAPIVAPVDVPAVNDGHIVHLHGLNLSRAAMLARVAPHNKPLLAAAKRLYDASVSQASQGFYVSTHWLPTFAWMGADALDAASV